MESQKEKEMSRRMKKMWTHKDTPEAYHQIFTSEIPSGLVDEPRIATFFTNYLPKTNKIIVDLGIGTGRELDWIDRLAGLAYVIGVDYSKPMVTFCRKHAAQFSHTVICIQDDLLRLKRLPKLLRKIRSHVVFLSLINSFGNFSRAERTSALKNLKPFLHGKDRVVLALYKRPPISMRKRLPVLFPKAAYPKKKKDRLRLAFALEYALIPYVWSSAMEQRKTLPQFWFDEKTSDVIIHTDGKRMVISHRFDKKEIRELARKAGLAIDKLITGQFMYVVVLKKNKMSA